MANGNILLVEDNLDDVDLTLRAFRQNNILNNVVVTRDGLEALDYLLGTGMYEGRNTNDKPALIMLDLKLPKIDGFEVLRRIRVNKTTQLLPVVILTSSTEEQDIIRGYELGANSYIRKPVDFVKFIEVLKFLGVYWLILNVPPLTTKEVMMV